MVTQGPSGWLKAPHVRCVDSFTHSFIHALISQILQCPLCVRCLVGDAEMKGMSGGRQNQTHRLLFGQIHIEVGSPEDAEDRHPSPKPRSVFWEQLSIRLR